jgi:hypothetical protein
MSDPDPELLKKVEQIGLDKAFRQRDTTKTEPSEICARCKRPLGLWFAPKEGRDGETEFYHPECFNLPATPEP